MFHISIQNLALLYLFLIASIVFHEYAHAFVAVKRGDDTPYRAGRLTLNPLAHIDPIGTVLLPVFAILFRAPVIGWAKPVPINQYNLYDPKKDLILVSLAGPAANMLIATILSTILWFGKWEFPVFLKSLLTTVTQINIVLTVFNLLPIPPLDGSKVLIAILPYRYLIRYEMLMPFGIFIIWFMLMSRMLWRILSPIVDFISNLLLGGVYGYV